VIFVHFSQLLDELPPPHDERSLLLLLLLEDDGDGDEAE
jgi:hypothetical protein